MTTLVFPKTAVVRSVKASTAKVVQPTQRVKKLNPLPEPATIRTQLVRKAAQPTPDHSIFREKALANVARGDPLDALIRTVGLLHWVALLGLIGVLAMMGFWVACGSVSTRIGGNGILIKPGGVKTADSTVPGQVVKVFVGPGDHVEKGQLIAELAITDTQWPLASRRLVRAGSDGRVMEVLVNIGTLVSIGTPLFTIESADSEHANLQALLYVPLADAMKLKTDAPAHLSPSTVAREEYGVVIGRVRAIGAFPVTKQAAMSSLSNEQLVDSMLADGPMLAVVVDLLPDPAAPSGYRWSSGAGPDGKLLPGTLCEARFTVRKQHPYELIVPGLRKLSGLADNAE